MEEKAEEITLEKRKRGRPKGSTSKQKRDVMVGLEPGDNSKITSHNLELAMLGRVDRMKPSELEKRSSQYMEICIRNDMRPSVAGYCLALGITRQIMWSWINDPSFHTPKDSIEVLVRFKALFNAQMEDYMQNGKINPVAGIFLMKNNYDYKDQQEVVLRPNNPEDSMSAENLIEEARLMECIDVTDTSTVEDV